MQLKRRLRKGDNHGVNNVINVWSCSFCHRILLSKAGWVNHVKSLKEKAALHIPQKQCATECTQCDKTGYTSCELGNHMVLKNKSKQGASTKVVANKSFPCHLCDKLYKYPAGLASHLRGHMRKGLGGESGRD